MLRPDTFALTALLALLTALGPLAVDMYLPSFPEIGRLLGASPATVQLTLSLYMVSYAVGQIDLRAVVGPLRSHSGTACGACGLLYGFARLRACAEDRDTARARARSRRSAPPARSCWRARSCAISIPVRAPGVSYH